METFNFDNFIKGQYECPPKACFINTYIFDDNGLMWRGSKYEISFKHF